MTLPLQSGPGYDPDLLLLNPDPYHYPTLDPYTHTLVLYMVLTVPFSHPSIDLAPCPWIWP